MDEAAGERGHRVAPRPGGVAVEAWAPTLGECLAEAVSAVVETFAAPPDRPASRTVPASFGPASPHELLVAILDEVVSMLDVLGMVPVSAAFDDLESGGMAGFFEVVPVAEVEIVGVTPKARAIAELSIEHDGLWRARVTFDA